MTPCKQGIWNYNESIKTSQRPILSVVPRTFSLLVPSGPLTPLVPSAKSLVQTQVLHSTLHPCRRSIISVSLMIFSRVFSLVSLPRT